MTNRTAFIYHDEYLKYQFGPYHPFNPIREKRALDILQELRIFDEKVTLHKPEPATEKDLHLIHSKEYVQYVKKMCDRGVGYLDYGDTPATTGLYEGSLRVVGGSILGARLIMDGIVDYAFNPGGGLHHAKAESAAGFCVFNDIAIVIRVLQRDYGIQRIAVVDIDGHHGDGTQDILYHEPILKISSHRIGIFPGTGYVDELGAGEGVGYSVNIPLIGRTGDNAYLYAFNEIVQTLLKIYQPEFLINQFGVDGHYQDPLVGLALTTRTYEEVAKTMRDLANQLCNDRLLVVGGGGYNIDNTARCWALMFATISSKVSTDRQLFNQLFDEPPDYEDERALQRTKQIVDEIKRTILPLHGIRG